MTTLNGPKHVVAKLIINDLEVQLPVSDSVIEALCDNADHLEDFSSEIHRLLKSLAPIENKKSCIVVGDVVLEFESEESILEGIYKTYQQSSIVSDEYLDDFDALLKKSVPYKHRPPSYKQVDYATQIAATLAIDLPAKALRNITACSKFIDQNMDAFEEANHQNRIIKREANRVARWSVATFLYIEGADLKSIATLFGVTKEETVLNYFNKYIEWKNMYSLFEGDEIQLILLRTLEVIEIEYSEMIEDPRKIFYFLANEPLSIDELQEANKSAQVTN